MVLFACGDAVLAAWAQRLNVRAARVGALAARGLAAGDLEDARGQADRAGHVELLLLGAADVFHVFVACCMCRCCLWLVFVGCV